MNKRYLYQDIYISTSIELIIIIFFSKVQIFFKRYFTIYVTLDFTPYENNVSFQFLILINNT